MGSKTDLLTSTVEHEVCKEDDEASQSLSSIASSEHSSSSSKDVHADQVPVFEPSIDCPPDNDCGLLQNCVTSPLAGSAGGHSVNDNSKVALSEHRLETSNTAFDNYMPGDYVYVSGQLLSTKEQQQPCVSSSGHLCYVPSCETKEMPSCLWDSMSNGGDLRSEAKVLGANTKVTNSNLVTPLGFRGSRPAVRRSKVDLNDSSNSFALRPHHFTSSSNFGFQATKPFNKVPQRNAYNPIGRDDRGYYNSRLIPSLDSRGKGNLHSANVYTKSRTFGQSTYNNISSRMSDNHSLRSNYEASDDLVRGPRAIRMSSSLSSYPEQCNLNNSVRRDSYNKSDFQITYEYAKFFMIKSFSEDDIHKSIKYNVWASTPNGNMKLDAAYWEAETLRKEKGTKCPVFLFFSVNSSGQFVGLAEMTGPVDFEKNMDFWQEEIWNGFFPVAWHVIKDIPNRHFQSITLENNDNKAVTFSRDTQEIGLPQGLRMLHIFKGYLLGKSILDDFEFYEKRESSLRAKRGKKTAVPRSDEFDEFDDGGSSMKHLEAAVREMSVSGKPTKPSNFRSSAIVTKNISTNNRWQRTSHHP